MKSKTYMDWELMRVIWIVRDQTYDVSMSYDFRFYTSYILECH